MLSFRSEEYIEGPRHAIVTPDDNGPILQIASYFLIVAAILATLLRLFLRVNIAQAAGLDDGLACLAMVSTLPLFCDRSVVDMVAIIVIRDWRSCRNIERSRKRTWYESGPLVRWSDSRGEEGAYNRWPSLVGVSPLTGARYTGRLCGLYVINPRDCRIKRLSVILHQAPRS